jgi:heme A synthase
VWLALILAQAALGAATIWTGKAADIATAHVAVGALSLVTGVALCLMAVRLSNHQVSATTLARSVMDAPRQTVGANG